MTSKEISGTTNANANLISTPSNSTETTCTFGVGQTVIATIDLIESGDDGFPALLYANAGKVLVVRKINDGQVFPVSVSRSNVTDRYFGVRANEIELAPEEVLIGAEIGRSVASGNTAAKTETHMRN
jgi:bifunctional ADP-heptose synthase (sugar kinase/adenylyltransferase)